MTNPAPAEIQTRLQEGLEFHRRGQFPQAEALYKAILQQNPTHADARHLLGLIAYQTQRYDMALELIDVAIGAHPDCATFHSSRGLCLHALARLNEAVAAYDKAIVLNPAFAEAHFNRGRTLGELKQFDAAVASYDRALSANPQFSEAYVNRGNALLAANNYEAAIASFDRAIAAVPDHAEAHCHRGIAFLQLGRFHDALSSFDRALAQRPNYMEAWDNRGLALKGLARLNEALENFTTAAKLAPEADGPKRHIFGHHLSLLSDIRLIERSSAELTELRIRREMNAIAESGGMAPFSVLHELEQTGYLLAQGYAYQGLRDANLVLAEAQARAGTAALIPLSSAEIAVINRYRKHSHLYAPVVTPGNCLNPENDWHAIEEQYFDASPSIVHIDNLLSQQALAELRKFCLLSNVWRTIYGNHYAGAIAEYGFVSPLHVQIAVELQQRLPRIFGEHLLEQLWAFKYASKYGAGTGLHADFARINFNFWITPDEANLDPTSGGMVIHDLPCPPSWPFQEYNHSNGEQRIRDFLKKEGAGSRKIPYRCNRAVLFDSSLFHETDSFEFKDGYENRRINVTYLFGKQLF